jgi:hypothetical protein
MVNGMRTQGKKDRFCPLSRWSNVTRSPPPCGTQGDYISGIYGVGGVYKPYGQPELKNWSLRVKTGEVATLIIFELIITINWTLYIHEEY